MKLFPTIEASTVLLCFLLSLQNLLAQNLVPNPDFERIEKNACQTCDEKGDFEHMAFPWKAPVKYAAPEIKTFDHAKVNKGLAFVESPVPHSGNMMVAFHPYQYLSVRLNQTLSPGERYYAEFWLVAASETHTFCNNFGLYFSEDAPTCAPHDGKKMPLSAHPQILESSVVKKKGEHWYKISGIFTAQRPHKFVTIGNFFAMDRTKTEGESQTPAIETMRYFLDDVGVFLATEEVLIARSEEFSDGSTFRLENVTFETGSATLTSGSLPELDIIAAKMKLDKSANLQISGHTDNVGKEEDNISLSTQRAKTLKGYLMRRGIKKERIFAKGYGSARPVVPNDTEAGRAKNRRVEITVVKE